MGGNQQNRESCAYSLKAFSETVKGTCKHRFTTKRSRLGNLHVFSDEITSGLSEVRQEKYTFYSSAERFIRLITDR